MQALWRNAVVVIVLLLVACASAAPTTAPTKVPPPSGATGPAPTAAASKPAEAPTAAPTKPAAATPTPAAKVKRGGTLRVSIGNTSNLDPHLTTSQNQAVHRLLYDALFRYELVDDKTNRYDVVGELAESWQMVDPKTFVFKLRQGVKFHDGTAFDAEVSKWNIERMINHKKSTAKTFVESIDSVKVIDPSTIHLSLRTPSANLLQNLSGMISPVSMISKAAVEKLGDDGFDAAPVGSGPMQFVEWLRDDQWTVKKFDGYWRTGADGQPLPYLDRVIARIIVDPAVVLTEMRAGTIDIMTDAEPKDVELIKKLPGLVYSEDPSNSASRIVGVFPVGPFSEDVRLRRALIHAIDKESMAKTITFGTGRAHHWVYWLPGFLGYDESLPYYPYDVNKSKQLLAEAGYPNGIDTVFISVARPIDIRNSEILKQMWEQAGIRAQVDSIERSAYLARMKNNNTELAMWAGAGGPDPDTLTRNLGTGAVGNWSNWSDSRVDKLLEEGRSSYDPKERAEIYKRIQRIVYEEAFVTGLYYVPGNMVRQKSVQGAKMQFKMLDLREAWLDK